MSRWDHTDLAEALSRNPSIRLSPQNRAHSPSKPLTPQTAILTRSTPVPPETIAKATKPAMRKLALAMSEDDLQQSVIDLANLYGWKVAHFRSVKVQRKDGTTFWQTPVAADGVGFPDLLMVKKSRVLAVELKKEREKPSPAQVEWLHVLMLTRRVETYLWKPSQWLDGTIEGLLR